MVNNNFSKKNKIKLYKNKKTKAIIISPNLIEFNNYIYVDTLKEKIENYLTTLQKDCKNFDITIFKENYKKTQFNIGEIYENLIDGTNGLVCFGKINKLEIKTFKIINHELLHLSSLKNEKHSQYFIPINEGYTQLLSERYFNENTGKVYIIEVSILKIIESILGKNNLERKYFNGKFVGITRDLQKYESKENISKLCEYIYEIYLIERSETLKEYENRLQFLINEVYVILFSCLKNKIIKTKQYQKSIDEEIWCKDICIYDDNIYKFKTIDKKYINEFESKKLLKCKKNTK